MATHLGLREKQIRSTWHCFHPRRRTHRMPPSACRLMAMGGSDARANANDETTTGSRAARSTKRGKWRRGWFVWCPRQTPMVFIIRQDNLSCAMVFLDGFS